MAFNPDQYYPQRPGGPFLSQGDFPGVPRVVHTNFDTEKVLEDRVRNVPIFQGLNEQQLWGYIENEINYAKSNRIGLWTEKPGRINKAADTFMGQN